MIVTDHLLAWIRDQLTIRHWNVADFAKHTKTTRTGWVRILNGETRSLSAKAIMDLARVFNLPEVELYRMANPHQSFKVHESSGTYLVRDALVKFIEGDIIKNPDHKQAYEGIAAAFGYRKP